MSLLGIYVIVVLPAIALLMGWGAHCLVQADVRRLEIRDRLAGKAD